MHDVIIVGGGPAGSAAALTAARRGLRVLLLDRKRFPRDKVCGDAITPLGVAMLAQLGLLEDVRRVADEQVEGIAFGFGGEVERCTLPTPLLVVQRCVLDAVLLDAARPRIEIREGWGVDEVLVADGTVRGVAGKDDRGERFEVTARAVIGADGASSVIARETGCRGPAARRNIVATRAYYRDVVMPERALEFHFLPELGGGYVWFFPAGGNRFNVGLGMSAQRVHDSGLSLRAWRDQALRAGPLAPRLAHATLISEYEGGQIPFTVTTQRLCGAGFVIAGDAAGAGDPFWGDGIDTALATGLLAGAHVAAACQANDLSADRLAGYAAAVTRLLGGKHAAGFEMQRAAALDAASLRSHLMRVG